MNVIRRGSTVLVVGTDQIREAREQIPWAVRWTASYAGMCVKGSAGEYHTINIYEVSKDAQPCVTFYGVEA